MVELQLEPGGLSRPEFLELSAHGLALTSSSQCQNTSQEMEMSTIIDIPNEEEVELAGSEQTNETTSHSPLGTSLEEQIRKLAQISTDCCIYRVSPKLRNLDYKVFTPQLVSIGPLHHGSKDLVDMEGYKLMYLKEFLDRTKLDLGQCIALIRNREPEIRQCYVEKIKICSDKFVKMVLLDCCFIIEVIWRGTADDIEELSGYLNSPEMLYGIQTDLILLENQLPFFVLDELFKLGFPSFSNTTGKEMAFVELSIRYFCDLMLIKKPEILIENAMANLESSSKVRHFVDLLRICHLPSVRRSPTSNGLSFIPARNAMALSEAGISFRMASSNCLPDLKYTPGVLEIPKLELDDFSEHVLKNVITFEQYHYPWDSYILDYVFFMDSLIDTAGDVDLLIHKGIIVNWLSDSNTAAALFNNLGRGTVIWGLKYYYNTMSAELNAYSKVRKNRWWASLKRDYCSSPWKIVATASAICLLILTFIQTTCSVIAL